MRRCRFSRNKKAILGLTDMGNIMTELFLIITLIAASFGYITSMKDGTYYNKHYLSRDLAYLLDTIYSVPGNVFFEYNNPKINFSKLAVKVSGNFVEVMEKEGKSRPISFNFASNSRIAPIAVSIDSQPILLSKSGNSLSLSSLNLNLLDCGDEEIIDSSGNSIFFIEVGGNPVNEEMIGLFKESQINSFIASSLAWNLDKSFFDVKYSRKAGEPDELAYDRPRREDGEMEELMDSSNVFLSINLDGNENKKDLVYVKAYYVLSEHNTSKKSQYLACNIVNSVLSYLPGDIDSISTIPINIDYVSDDMKKYLKEDKISVYLAFGNFKGENLDSFLNDKSKLRETGKAISDGVVQTIK